MRLSIAKPDWIPLRLKPFDQPETKWSHYSIPAFDDGGYPANDLGSEIKSGKHLVNPEAILISKLNPSQWRCWRPDPLIVDEHAICSPEFMQIVGKDVSRNWIWGYVTYKIQRSSQLYYGWDDRSRQRAKPKVVMQQLVVFPAADIEKLYNDTVRPISQPRRMCFPMKPKSWYRSETTFSRDLYQGGFCLPGSGK